MQLKANNLCVSIAVTTFKGYITQGQSDLSELIQIYTASRYLQSSGYNRLLQNLVKYAFAERAICHAAPAVRNSYPNQFIPSNFSCFTSINAG